MNMIIYADVNEYANIIVRNIFGEKILEQKTL
jgi:hypothetical protein